MTRETFRNGYDLAILGSGSAAFAAAIRARDHGAKVAIVESGTVGGTCVNVGCVPSKTLLRAAEVQRVATDNPFAGINASADPVDLPALIAQKDELVSTLRQDKYIELLAEYDVDLIQGEARFVDQGTLDVDGRLLTAGAYLIATGAAPSVPPIPGLAEAGYLTSTTALDLDVVPGALAVIGANAIGLELGQYFGSVGSDVTFFEAMDRIAPFEEPEISQAMADLLRDRGADVRPCAHIVRVEPDGDKRVITATFGSDTTEQRFIVDEILVATGRRPNTAHIGANAAGITLDARGFVVVDEQLRTTNPRVFAAGDVTPSPQFVYVAAHHGSLAADNALTGSALVTAMNALPRVIFTSPQIAAAGLTEQEATTLGHPVKTSVLPLSAVPRALVNHDTAGLLKIVADGATDKVLGVHILADGAGDVIQAAVYAIKFGLTTHDLANTWSPYLTMAEGLKLAAQTFSRDVSKLSCCAA